MRLRLGLILGAVWAALFIIAPVAAAEDGTPPPCEQSLPPCTITIVVQPPPPPPPPHIVQNVFGEVPVIAGPSKKGLTRIDPLYSKIVRTLSGVSNGQARCWGPPDWSIITQYVGQVEGFVMVDGRFNAAGDQAGIPNDKAHLSPNVCAHLDLLAYARKYPRNHNVKTQAAKAVNVLAHESMHVGGADSEMIAQCHAIQKVEQTALMLGVKSRAYAHDLGQFAWQYVTTSLPLVYNSPLCRDGGLFDLNPMSPSWPS